MTAVVVVIAWFGLWEAPARTATYTGDHAGEGVPVSDVVVEPHGWWTVCVSGAMGEGAQSVGVILPDTWTAHRFGVIPRAVLDRSDAEVRDRASGTVMPRDRATTLEGTLLDVDDPDDAVVAQQWVDLCGEADLYAAMTPLAVLE